MIELLVLWLYMLLICSSIGFLVSQIIVRILKGKGTKASFSFMGIQVLGIAAVTVFIQVWSLFGKISFLAHAVTLVLAVCSIWLYCREAKRSNTSPISDVLKKLKDDKWISWEGFLYFILIFITAYFSSRGAQHTDTYIYHAEMIRLYEDYGILTGVGNLQNHFAYNSAYLAFSSVFSMKWLCGRSLHGAGGYMQAIAVVWATYGLLRIKQHKRHLADAGRIAIILYAIVNSEYIMSPATDFGSLYLVLLIIVLWLENCEKPQTELVDNYALLCVGICLAVTYKLSTGMLVVAVIYPAYVLIKEKRYKDILKYLGLGVIILLPWLIRNVIISGYVVYPLDFTGIKGLDWRIPEQYLYEDNAGITCWGRCLYDRSMMDVPMREWLPVWWAAKDTYEKMLIEANLFAGIAEALWIVINISNAVRKKAKIEMPLMALKIAILMSLVIWFVQAPFIRYGLAFLLVVPLVEVAQWIEYGKNRGMGIINSPLDICTLFLSIAILCSLMIYVNYYTQNDVVLAKQLIKEPYYVSQKDYDYVELRTEDLDGIAVNIQTEGEGVSYAPFPASSYVQMIERTKLRGSTLEDGFMPR